MLYSSLMLTQNQLRIARRNFQLGVLNGLLFIFGETLLDPALVLAVFISHLTPSPIWLGLLMPLRDGGWFLPQLWVSGFLQSWPRKIALYRWVAAIRFVSWTLMTLAVFFVRDPRWLLVAFIVPFTISSIAAGFSGLPFMEIVGKTVPPRQRGLFFAWRLALGSAASIGAGFLVRWLLSASVPLTFPYNFGVVFGVASGVMTLGLLAFCFINEPPDSTVRPRASFAAQLRRARQIVGSDSNFRRFIYMRVALMLAGAPMPFLAVYVQQNLGGSVEVVGVYLAVFSIGYLLANIFFGRFSARRVSNADDANRRMMILATAAGGLMTGLSLALIVLAAPLGLSGAAASLWLLPVFLLSAIRESGLGIAGQSLLLDLAPREERTIYLGFTHSLLGIVFLMMGASGVLVEYFGYLSLLVLALAAHLVALLSALRMKDK